MDASMTTIYKNHFEHNGADLYIEFAKYGNNRTAVIVNDSDGQQYAVLSVNIPEADLEDGEFIVKNYSENQDIARSVFKTGWFVDTGKKVRTGFVEVPVWRFK